MIVREEQIRVQRERDRRNKRERAERLRQRLAEGREPHQVKPIYKLLAWLMSVEKKWSNQRHLEHQSRYRKKYGSLAGYRPSTFNLMEDVSDGKLNRLLNLAYIDDQRGFRRGDEQTHWGNHPVCIRYMCVKRQLQHDKDRTNYGLARRVRTRVYRVMMGYIKSKPTEMLLGCTWKQLREHIESQFIGRMSWDNYGRSWHIDHIVPCAEFDLSKPEQQQRCFHFSNLRPLWAKRNRQKHDKVEACQPELLISFHAKTANARLGI